MRLTALHPDLVLLNGQIYSMNQDNDIFEAVAIQDGRIVAVGRDIEMEALCGRSTAQIDLSGRAVIPGIVDAHVHVMEMGIKETWLRLDECHSVDDMIDLVRERAAATPPGRWIIGHGWNEDRFVNGQMPTRQHIDRATRTHPVVLMRVFNKYVVNTRALEETGIDSTTPSPDGGRIMRDADGDPTGLLFANAKNLVMPFLPQPSSDQMERAIRYGVKELHRNGITGFIEPGLRPWELRAYQSLYDGGGLLARANLMVSWHGYWCAYEDEEQLEHRVREMGFRTGFGNDWLRIGGLKMAIDGGISPRTAYMYEPFEGESVVHDNTRLALSALPAYVRQAVELGWDLGIHCVGDRAQDEALVALWQVADLSFRQHLHHSIIHACFPTQRALDRMAELKVAAVIQPSYIYYGSENLSRHVGESRLSNYIPARRYLTAGVQVASSSDMIYTESANPFSGLYALVRRRNQQGQGIAADEAISRDEALRTYITAGAWLTREDEIKGTLARGKLADMIVLDRDYFRIPAEEIKDVQVDMTIIGGEVMYERSAE